MEINFVVKPQEQGAKLGNYLRHKGISMSLLRSVKYMPNGLLRNTIRARTNEIIQTGDKITVNLPEAEGFSALPQPMPLQVVYETEHVLAIEKPPGLVMHPTLSHKEGTLANGYCALMQARGYTGAMFRPVGRLDADTSGLVLCAQNAHAAQTVSESLRKEYLALVCGRVEPARGRIEAPLCGREDSAILQKVDECGKPSITEYEVVCAAQEATLVRVHPKTGRTHQIRVHFAHIGHPLVGDGLYGGRQDVLLRHALHCAKIYFTEPGSKKMMLASPLPEDIKTAAVLLGLA